MGGFFDDIGKGFTDLFTKGDPAGLGEIFSPIIKGGARIIDDPLTTSILMGIAPEFAPEIALATGIAHGVNHTNLF